MLYKISYGEHKTTLVEAGTAHAALILLNHYRTVIPPLTITRTDEGNAQFAYSMPRLRRTTIHHLLMNVFDLAIKAEGEFVVTDNPALSVLVKEGFLDKKGIKFKLAQKGLHYCCWHDNHVWLLRRLTGINERNKLTPRFVIERVNRKENLQWLGGERTKMIVGFIHKILKIPPLYTGLEYCELLGSILDQEINDPQITAYIKQQAV